MQGFELHCEDEIGGDGGEVESSIEAPGGFGEIALSVLAEVEGVMRAGERGLKVAQHGVDGLRGGMLGAGHAAAGDVDSVHDAFAPMR